MRSTVRVVWPMLLAAIVSPVGLARAQDGSLADLGRSIVERAEKGDVKVFRIDVDALIGRAARGIDLKPQTREVMLSACKAAPDTFGGLVLSRLEQGGLLTFMRVRKVGERKTLLFRLIEATGLVVYLELEVVPPADGSPMRIVDLYYHGTGEWMSQSLRRNMVIPTVHDEEKDVFARVFGDDSPEAQFLAATADIAAMSRARDAGEPARALEIFERLPEVVRTNKTVLVTALQAALAADDGARYGELLALFDAEYPGDPASLLLSLYALSSRGEEARFRESLEKLLKILGEDGYLRHLLGGSWLRDARYDQARGAFEKGIAAEPDLSSPYFGLIDVALAQKAWDAALTAIERAERAGFEVDLEAPELAALRATEAYREWSAARRKD